MPGVKGRRIPGRPGRFDPTIPLHMTTRRKAAKTAPEMDMYPEDEYDDADSRRTSLDEISVTTPNSGFDSEPPAKRQRTADPSPQQSTVSLLDQRDLSVGAGKASSALFDLRQDVASGSQTSSGGAFATQTDVDISQDSIDPRLENEDDIRENRAVSADVPVTQGGSERDEPEPRSDKAQIDDMQQEYEAANGADVEDEATGIYTKLGPIKTHHQVNESFQSADEGDWLEVVNPLPSTKDFESREASVESDRSDVQAVRDLPLPEVSTDATPMATRQGSPATTASAAAEELTPARSKPADALEMTGSDEDEEVDGDDVEPATEIQDSMLENLEEEVEVPQYAEEYEEDDAPVRKTTKRRFAGGRRRAAHANAYVEAALRRQLEIKQFYRQVTRSMKSCLGELAQITLDDLETDQQHHTQVTEYEAVIAELDEQLARRKKQLLNAQRFNHEQLSQRHEAESDSRKNRCRNFLEDIKEQQLVNLEYNMLQVNRAKLHGETKAGHETEDEDGVIPRPKRMGYRFNRSNAIDARYDSRSRFTMETERRVDDLQCRTHMWEALKAFDPEAAETFTVMDSGAREAAEEKRRNIQATSALANIAFEYEHVFNAATQPQPHPAPTAEDLAPLNALAALAVQPAMRPRRSKAMPLQSSSNTVYLKQSPRQSRAPLPSQSLFDRSAGAAPPQAHQSPFARLAMEQNRGPARGLGQFPISSLLSPSMPPSEEAPTLPTAGLPRSVDSRPLLAAKPAAFVEQADDERPKPTQSQPHPAPPTAPLVEKIMADAPKLHPERARLIAAELSWSLEGQSSNQQVPANDSAQADDSKQPTEQAPTHSGAGQNHEADDQARRDAMRNTSSLPPLSDIEDRWRGPITSVNDRDGNSRRQSGLRPRTKRQREEDSQSDLRDVRPRASTTTFPAQQRPRSISEIEADERANGALELQNRLATWSPRSRRIAGFPDNAEASLPPRPPPSEHHQNQHHGPRPTSSRDRRLSSQSHRGRRPSVGSVGSAGGPARRSSEMHPPPHSFQQQQQQGGGPFNNNPPQQQAFPVSSFMNPPNWPNGPPMFNQQPMSAPTAQPIDHFAISHGGFGGGPWRQPPPPFQPGPGGQQQQQQPGPSAPFRDYYGRR